MSGTIAIILIASVWLFVLAPWLLRGHRPISKTGDAFDEPRVVHQGEQNVPHQRRPRVRRDDIHVHEEREDHYEVVAAEDTVLEDAPGATLSDILRDAKEKLKKKRGEALPVVEGEVVHELPAAQQPEEHEAEVAEDQAQPSDLFEDDDATEYPYSDAYVSPADLMREDDPAEQQIVEQAHEAAEEAPLDAEDLEDYELDQTDLDFAARRVGRGGWDPEAYREHRAALQRRRKQWIAAFSGTTALALVAAIIFGGWVWAAFGVAAALLVVYLVALRRQVVAEEALRRRRIRQLRRARMGVRNHEDAELGVPQRLRHPGAVVLEIDDESPDFEHLEYHRVPMVDDLDERRVG